MPASFHWGNRGWHQRADHYGPGGRGFEDRGGSQRHRCDVLAGSTRSDWAQIGTIIFTIVQTFTVMVKNWGDWSAWWTARMGNARRFWAWIRGRG